MSNVLHLYRTPAFSESSTLNLLNKSKVYIPSLITLSTEFCFNVEISENLNQNEYNNLIWLLRETFQPENFSDATLLKESTCKFNTIIEVGPRLSFTSAFSTNVVNICKQAGLSKITRVERSRRFNLGSDKSIDNEELLPFLTLIHDRMTEMVYTNILTSFQSGIVPEKVYTVPVMKEGKYI